MTAIEGGNAMTTPTLRITFHGMDPSPAVESRIREKVEGFSDRIHGCHITVEAPHRHGHSGKLYKVGLTLQMPGQDVIVNRTGPQDHAHEDVYVALRDAFDAATRQIEDHVRIARGD
jgi:ribosome-associated translation inhibitor RaiA